MRFGTITCDLPVLRQYSVIGARSVAPPQNTGVAVSDATTRRSSPLAREPSAIGWMFPAFSLLSTKTDASLTKPSRSSSTRKDVVGPPPPASTASAQPLDTTHRPASSTRPAQHPLPELPGTTFSPSWAQWLGLWLASATRLPPSPRAPAVTAPARLRRVCRRDRVWPKLRTSPSNRSESILTPSF